MENEFHSELRQDLVTGDWILIAPGRAKRPEDFITKIEARIKTKQEGCPFEDPQQSGNGKPSIIYKNANGDWDLQVIQNKYPAVFPAPVIPSWEKRGNLSVLPGVGHHDIVITRDHDKNFAELSRGEAALVFHAFQERYRMYAQEKQQIAYAAIFHNWGPKAGASLYHPHYQIIALPIVPPDIAHSLYGSADYLKKHQKCVHCVLIEQEAKDKSRVVYENDYVIAYAPFVSRVPFEIRLFPKTHSPYFEDAGDGELDSMIEALQKVLTLMKTRLNDTDYNFFIHTAPILEKERHGHYHWHIEIEPKISILAGFELSTGIVINVVDPVNAAAFLNGATTPKA